MITKLNLSRPTIRIVRFLFAFGLFIIFEWDEFQSDPVRVLWQSAILGLLMVFINEITDSLNNDGHVIYSSLELEDEIVIEITKLGYNEKQTKDGLVFTSGSSIFSRRKFKIVKNEHFLKVTLPAEFVEQFDKYVR